MIKMITVKRIDGYRDGGTIAIECAIYSEKEILHTEICIDNRIGSIQKGSIWVGYPNRFNSYLLDKKYIPLLVNAINDFSGHFNDRVTNALSYLKI